MTEKPAPATIRVPLPDGRSFERCLPIAPAANATSDDTERHLRVYYAGLAAR